LVISDFYCGDPVGNCDKQGITTYLKLVVADVIKGDDEVVNYPCDCISLSRST